MGHSRTPKPSSQRESCLHRDWGSTIQGLSSTLALTKSCLVSPQLQPRLTITATVSDGINNEVSAGARAGWLQGEGSPHGQVHGQGSVGRQLEAGGWGWLAGHGGHGVPEQHPALLATISSTPILCPL